MVDVHHTNVCAAPVSFAFGWVDDYRNTPRFMFGLSEFEPVRGRPSQGLGAAFELLFKVGPVKIRSTVEVVEWVQDELIRFDSIKGFRNGSTWAFAAEGDARTRVTVDLVYELPGGLPGKALGRAIEPIVAPAVKHSDADLRKLVEAEYAAAK